MENKYFVPLKTKEVRFNDKGEVLGADEKIYRLRISSLIAHRIGVEENVKPLQLLMNAIKPLMNAKDGENVNELDIIDKIPDIDFYTTLLYYALQYFHSEQFKKKEDVAKVVDDFLMDGHTHFDLIEILIQVYQVSGLFPTAPAVEK